MFPDLTVLKPEVSVFGGAQVVIAPKALLIEDDTVALWSDKYTAECKVTVKHNDKELASGDYISEEGKLTLTVTNDQGKSSTAEITLTNEAVSGEARLGDMQVDEEVDLLSGITFVNNATLVMVEIEVEGQRTEIANPQHFVPEYPATCAIIFTVTGKNGNQTEIKVDNLTINPLDYKAIEVTNIKPVDILPII